MDWSLEGGAPSHFAAIAAPAGRRRNTQAVEKLEGGVKSKSGIWNLNVKGIVYIENEESNYKLKDSTQAVKKLGIVK